MATSPIYSWPEPDNTDLVKNGALAIRTLGDAIDTTMGTMVAKTIVDAKGDLIAATAADTVSRIAVGANDTVLTADSSTATGLKWAAVAGGSSFAGTRLLKTSGNQSIADSTFTAVTWNTEVFDVGGYHDLSTNTSRITIPAGKGGYYRFSWQEYVLGAASVIYLYKNGSRISYDNVASDFTACFTAISAGAAGDYFEVYLRQTSGSSKTIADEANGASWITWFDCNYLGA